MVHRPLFVRTALRQDAGQHFMPQAKSPYLEGLSWRYRRNKSVEAEKFPSNVDDEHTCAATLRERVRDRRGYAHSRGEGLSGETL